MRARIIFQGLTFYSGAQSTRGAKPGDNIGPLTALLVSDPRHATMPLHKHTPRMALNGRDLGQVTGPGNVSKKALPHSPKQSTTIQLQGHGPDTGVVLDGSFLDYVPCLPDLHWATSTGIRDEFIMARIVITSGTIYARSFIGWNWNGSTPARIGYMGTTFQGFGANDVVVEMGDDNDFAGHDLNRFLSIAGAGVNEKLWPRIKGAPSDEDIEPNYLEVRFSNAPARRLRPAPHGGHFMSVFDAAGYPRDENRYVSTAQYTDFEAAMLQYDKDAWSEDVAMMGHGQPFPYLIDPTSDRLPALHSGTEPARAIVPPPTPGRRAGEGRSAGDMHGHEGHGGMSMGHDPDNTQICPHGRE